MSVQTVTNSIVSNAAGQFTWQIPIALKNVKALFFTFRQSTNVSGATNFSQYSLSDRSSLGITQAQISINGRTFPSNRFLQIEGPAYVANIGFSAPNFFMQAQKAFGNYIHQKASCSVDYALFNNSGTLGGVISPAGAVLSGQSAFVLAYNLEGLHEQDDQWRTCMEMNAATTFLTFTTSIATDGGNSTIDCFALYEMDLIINNGTLTTDQKYITTLDIQNGNN